MDFFFPSNTSKGLIFYIHGGSERLENMENIAKVYTQLGFDFFTFDFRGYGKSGGKITSENQLYSDVQYVYDTFKGKYIEENIIVSGFSIGTGMATNLCSKNSPSLFILKAPFYNMEDLTKNRFPLIPSFVIRYKFLSNEYIKNCKMPIYILHGTDDEVVYYDSSVKLALESKNISLIPLAGQKHNDISQNEQFQINLLNILK